MCGPKLGLACSHRRTLQRLARAYPFARTIRLLVDNLNTSLSRHFGEGEATRYGGIVSPSTYRRLRITLGAPKAPVYTLYNRPAYRNRSYPPKVPAEAKLNLDHSISRSAPPHRALSHLPSDHRALSSVAIHAPRSSPHFQACRRSPNMP